MPKKIIYDKEFKESVVQYMLDHPDTTKQDAARKFGCHSTTIAGWLKQYQENNNQIVVRGSGNYSDDQAKEIAHLKRELKNAHDALEVLKKAISILGK